MPQQAEFSIDIRPKPPSLAPLCPPRPGMGIIGIGAFGAFAIPHLARHFDLSLHDAGPHIETLRLPERARRADLETAARQDVVVLAVPFAALDEVARAIAPLLKPGALVVDVCSLKVRPLEILDKALPPHVDIVGTHPLFGPQSGKGGIGGLRIAVCRARGRRDVLVRRFLKAGLGLDAFDTTAEHHDRQMAYVQGLTHLLSRVILAMDLPPLEHTTPTFEHMMRMVASVRHDTDELYKAITLENPFADEMRARFLDAAKRLAGPDGNGATGICRGSGLSYTDRISRPEPSGVSGE